MTTEELSITMIAARVGTSERTVQRWIKSGLLPAQKLAHHRYAVNTQDLDALRLPEHHDEETRIEALERRVYELSAQVETLEGSIALLAEVVRQTPHTRQAPIGKHAVPAPAAQSDLPGGLVSWRTFAKVHGGIPESNISRAISSGKLPVVVGNWRAQHGQIREALDAIGRAIFYNLFHTHDRFTPCEDCPHQ